MTEWEEYLKIRKELARAEAEYALALQLLREARKAEAAAHPVLRPFNTGAN